MSQRPSPLLTVKDLKKYFPVFGGIFKTKIADVHAVDGVSLSVNKGQTLGLVGESGCGKSTLGRTILKLHQPTSGRIEFAGEDITAYNTAKMRPVRRDMQVIFQDPYESLNSRHTVGKIIEEAMLIHKIGTAASRRQKAVQLLEKVGLQASSYHRYPHEFSGGQRQRIGIARALSLEPKLIICDEAVSALDVSIQGQVMNLLIQLQQEMNLAYIFIAHDLAIVRHISDKVAVMYLGKIVEYTDADAIYENPLHPYTKALISAIPEVKPTKKKDRIVLHGDVPSPINPPSGCSFHTRCPYAVAQCKTHTPELKNFATGDKEQLVACHLAGEV